LYTKTTLEVEKQQIPSHNHLLDLTWDQTRHFYNRGEEAIHQVITIAHTCLVYEIF